MLTIFDLFQLLSAEASVQIPLLSIEKLNSFLFFLLLSRFFCDTVANFGLRSCDKHHQVSRNFFLKKRSPLMRNKVDVVDSFLLFPLKLFRGKRHLVNTLVTLSHLVSFPLTLRLMTTKNETKNTTTSQSFLCVCFWIMFSGGTIF